MKAFGYFIIASALIWGMTIIAASLMMGDFIDKQKVLQMLGAGAGLHLILIWGPLAAIIGRMKAKLSKQEEGEETGEA